MLSIFKKKLFVDISGNAEDMPPHVSAVLCLMIEIARMDGKVDQYENSLFMQIGEMLLIDKDELASIQG